jgi:hypothetical protein
MLLALATTSPALVVDEFLLVGLALAAVAPWPVIVVAGLAVFLLSPRLSEDQQKSVTS